MTLRLPVQNGNGDHDSQVRWPGRNGSKLLLQIADGNYIKLHCHASRRVTTHKPTESTHGHFHVSSHCTHHS